MKLLTVHSVNCLNRQLELYFLSSPNIHPAKVCFVYYDFNKVFSSYQPCQFVKNRQVSGTVSPSSGQWCNCGSRLSHITTPNRQCSIVNANHVGVSGRSQVLEELDLPDWCIFILLQHVRHQAPGPTECKASVPLKVA